MKTLNTLIRLSKRTLDELRKKQVSLESQKAQLLEVIKRLGNELASEQKVAAKTPEMGAFFGGFAKRIKLRENDIQAEVKKLDDELAVLSEEILVAFAELKKYEIALDNKKARIKAEEARKETIAMDEVAATNYSRKKEADSLVSSGE